MVSAKFFPQFGSQISDFVMCDTTSAVRCEVLSRLKSRNELQTEPFTRIVVAYELLLQQVEPLKKENFQLKLTNQRLRDRHESLSSNVDGVERNEDSKRVQQLEQKLFRVQEELTDLHRKRGSDAQQVLELTGSLREKERIIGDKDLQIEKLTEEIASLKEDIVSLEAANKDILRNNQLLLDEHTALQITLESLEKKHTMVEAENRELLDRWMKSKAALADILNEENENFRRRKQKLLEKRLEEAASVAVEIPPVVESEQEGYTGPVFSTLPQRVLAKFDAHDGDVNAVKWSPSGKYLATGGADRKVKLWDLQRLTGTCSSKGMLVGSNAAIMSLDFDSSESLIVGASNDYAFRVWSPNEQRLRDTLTGHSNRVMVAKFQCGDSRKVVSGSHDRTLKVWDLRNRACVRTLFAASVCNDLVTSDTSAMTIISGHLDKKIRFWDTRAESAMTEMLLNGKVSSLDLSRDGKFLLASSRDDSLVTYDLRMNQLYKTYTSEAFRVSSDWARCTFSPDGSYVAAGSWDGSVIVWEFESGSVAKVLKEHSAAVVGISWNPACGDLLTTGDRNKTCIVWSS